MSKIERMLKKSEIQVYTGIYNDYLDGEQGLSNLRDAENELLEAGYNREQLEQARLHVREGRIRGRGANEVAAAC